MTCPDSIFLYIPSLFHSAWQNQSRLTLSAVLLPLSPILLWFLFSLVYFGFFFPNRLFAKLFTGVFREEYLDFGTLYLYDFLVNDPAGAVAIVIGGFLCWTAPHTSVYHRLAFLGVLFYTAYVVWIGGDFMSGRLMSLPTLFSIFLILHLADTETSPSKIAALTTVLLVLGFLSHGDFQVSRVGDQRAVYSQNLQGPELERKIDKTYT